MKMAFTLLFLIPLIGMSQEKIDGIGPFKINQTAVVSFTSIMSNLNVKLKESDNLLDTYVTNYNQKKTEKVLLLKKNEKQPSRSDPFAPEIIYEKVFFIDYYEVAGIPITKVYLYFWNDTLYKLTCESSPKLSEALGIKYGNPKVETKEKEVKCRSGFGAEYTEKETSIYSTWDGKGDIHALEINSKYFDSKCRAQYVTKLIVEDYGNGEKITRFKLAEKAKMKKVDSAQKKEILKGL